jgi:hypothetical protein
MVVISYCPIFLIPVSYNVNAVVSAVFSNL